MEMRKKESPGSPARITAAPQAAIDSGRDVIVGVNKYQQDEQPDIPMLRIDEAIQKEQVESLAKLKAERDDAAVKRALSAIADDCRADRNVMPGIVEAAKVYCTEQEICDVFREVFGQHQDRPEF